MAKRKTDKATTSEKKYRIGNFNVVFTDIESVPVIEVSNLGGTWMVRIPSDFQMYGLLNRLLLESQDDDVSIRTNAEEWLKMFFMNWQNATGIPNGQFQQAIVMLSCAYSRPELLKPSWFGDSSKFYADAKRLRKSFLKWAAERDKLLSEEEASYDAEKESIADDAKQIINGEQK